jgi:hypothetical protein
MGFHHSYLYTYLCSSKNVLKSGVDVMITIFGGKNGVFLENQCYDQILAKLAVVLS